MIKTWGVGDMSFLRTTSCATLVKGAGAVAELVPSACNMDRRTLHASIAASRLSSYVSRNGFMCCKLFINPSLHLRYGVIIYQSIYNYSRAPSIPILTDSIIAPNLQV